MLLPPLLMLWPESKQTQYFYPVIWRLEADEPLNQQ